MRSIIAAILLLVAVANAKTLHGTLPVFFGLKEIRNIKIIFSERILQAGSVVLLR